MKYPDFDDVMAPHLDGSARVSSVIEQASFEVGPESAYLLAKDPDLDAMTAETLMDRNNPGFPAAVAGMKRYLKTLVASAQRAPSSPSRSAAVSTGSAPARMPTLVPRPPNPVRTSPMKDADAAPSDESSLADHERAFAPKRRRA